MGAAVVTPSPHDSTVPEVCSIFLHIFAQALSSAEYVVEAVPEDEDLKKVCSRITELAVSELQMPAFARKISVL